MDSSVDIHAKELVFSAIDMLRWSTGDNSVILYLIHAYTRGLFGPKQSRRTSFSQVRASIREKVSLSPEFEVRLYNVFEPSLIEIERSGFQFHRFYELLTDHDIEWYRKNAAALFDTILSFIQDFDGRRAGEYSQSLRLTNLIAEISGYDGTGILYNPFAGSASYCTQLAGVGRFIGQEINLRAWAIGVLRLLAYGKDPSSFFCEDSVSRWRGCVDTTDSKELFDCIVATPPFGMRIRGVANPLATGDLSTVEDFFIRNSLASLSDRGIAIGVFSLSVASQLGQSLELRRSFVDSDTLDTVIALPAGVFNYTGIQTIILKFSKNKENPGFVRFVNGVSFVKKENGRTSVLFDELYDAISRSDKRYVKSVELDIIRENDYNLTPVRYFREALPVPKGFVRRRLEDIVEIIPGDRCLQFERGKVVNVGSLSNNPFDHVLSFSSLQEEEVNRNFRKITIPVLLLSKVRSLKPTFAKASVAEPIFINPNVLAVRVKDNAGVFIPELIRTITKVEELETGASIPTISVSTIMALQIVMPLDIAMQEVLYRNAEQDYKKAKIRELGLEDLLATQRDEFIRVLRNRKHDINTYVGDIRNRLQGLIKFMRKTGFDKELYSVRQNKTVGENIEAILHSVNKMGQYLEHIADENTFGIPSKIDLFQVIKDIKDGPNYTVTSRIDIDTLRLASGEEEQLHAFVNISARDLDHVLLNIVSNAVKHGFVDESISDYRIESILSYDSESDMYVIEVRNNGKPMPEGIDTVRYGTNGEKAGSTQGEGKGGSIVKDTIEHYGGSLEVINEPDLLFPVSIILKLPRYDGE